MSRSAAAAVLLLAGVLTTTAAATEGSPPLPPSIVFVVADDLGFNDLGLTNQERYTPTIDRLANAGVRLEYYYSYKYCSPARASLLTGRYPGHGIWETNPAVDAPVGVNASLVMLPAALKRVGYKTHQIGKWHLGFYKSQYLPHGRGFDTSFGYIANGNQRAFDQVDPALPGPDVMGACAGTDLWNTTHEAWGRNGTYDAWMYTAVGQDIIARHDFTAAPLLLMLMFHNVHEPMEVPSIYYEQPHFPQDMPRTRLLYNGMCAALDESVANITASLEAAGAMNNTVFVFISDNGGNIGTGQEWHYSDGGGNNYPLRGGKFGFFEGGVRVPGFVYAPGVLPAAAAGQTLRSKVHVSDWWPTLTGLAGVQLNASELDGVDGIDIWPALQDPVGTSTNRTEVVLGLDGATYPPSGAYIYNDLKLVVGAPHGEKPNCWYGTTSPNGTLYCDVGAADACTPTPCLFNLTADPTEHTDLGASEPALFADMQKRFAAARARLQPSTSSLQAAAAATAGDGSGPHGPRRLHACMHSTCAVERGYLEWDGAYHSLGATAPAEHWVSGRGSGDGDGGSSGGGGGSGGGSGGRGGGSGGSAGGGSGAADVSMACQVMINNSRWWRPWDNADAAGGG